MRAFVESRWQYGAVMLCAVISVATGWMALAALVHQPLLRNAAGKILTTGELRKITVIEGVEVKPAFYNPIPDSLSARGDEDWWQTQRRVSEALAGKRQIVIQTDSNIQVVDVIRPGLANIANDALIVYFSGALYVVGALYIFFRYSTVVSFLLSLDFLSSAVSLFCLGATNLRYLSLSYDVHRLLFGLSTTGIVGFLVSAHFFASFPRRKVCIAFLPKSFVALAYGALLLQCLLIYLGMLPNISTFPVSAVLNIAILAALIHSFAVERDKFLKLQVGFLLGVVASGFVILYGFYAFAPLFGLAPLDTAQIALMFLIGLFAFGAVLESTTLYQQKLRSDEKAREEKEHLRQEFHDNILNRLANISLLSDAALRASFEDRSSVGEKVSAIKNAAGSYSRYARGLLWISDEQCSWNDFFSQLRQYGHDFVADHDLDFELAVDGAVTRQPAPLPIKACLYKIFVEALVNTIKHARAAKVHMFIDVRESQLTCLYRDDGEGFDIGGVKPGHYGLPQMHRHAREVGGELAIDSTIGGGTTLRLQIPLVLDAFVE